MKSNLIKSVFYLIVFSIVVVSCGDDDIAVPEVVERDRTEQQMDDDSLIVDYLNRHYYNSEFFQTGTNHRYIDIEITELLEGETVPAGHTLLIDAVETRFTTFQETDYQYYVLNLNQGGGDSPAFTDQVRVAYEGFSVESGDVFDSRITPEDLILTGVGFGSGAIRAWQLIIPTFNTSENFMAGNDGIINYDNYGLGVMFVPSGLGYFSGTNTGNSYDSLIFKFELLQYQEVDHDSDGIPSFIEDLDESIDVLDDDTDEDLAPNYVDVDDDNDGVNTIDELISMSYMEDDNMMPFSSEMEAQQYFDNNAESNELFQSIVLNQDGSTYTLNTLIIADSDGNDIPDYLEDSITINYNEEDDE